MNGKYPHQAPNRSRLAAAHTHQKGLFTVLLLVYTVLIKGLNICDPLLTSVGPLLPQLRENRSEWKALAWLCLLTLLLMFDLPWAAGAGQEAGFYQHVWRASTWRRHRFVY